MRREALESASVVARQLIANAPLVAALARRWHENPPRLILTCARGSSDHAATFAKYVLERSVRRPVASAAPSQASLYGLELQLAGEVVLAISQSGRSEDILAFMRAARRGGAETLAIVNDETSPLSTAAAHVLPLRAGPELSVAATKSFIASLSAVLQLAAAWGEDVGLEAALHQLPEALREVAALDWSAAIAPFATATSAFILGRGPALGIAGEAALKLKETCQIHAEAFSLAEVLHGPMAVIRPGFPVLAFLQDDESLATSLATLARLEALGATVISVGAAGPGLHLPVPPCSHPAVALLPQILGFHLLVEQIARRRGLDPDAPPYLNKVTNSL